MGALLWLIPLIPGASALILAVFGPKLPRKWVAAQASLAVLASFLLASAASTLLIRGTGDVRELSVDLGPWISSGSLATSFALSFDRLSAVMALVVTGVGLLIHIYSAGYMAGDRSWARYFAHLNLFTFFMLVLVLSADLVLMFVGWEGVGLCSYLLIGFWFERPPASRAGLKAFLVNRVGDAAFIVGMIVLLVNIGSSRFAEINAAAAGGSLAPGLATLAALLLFAGATGKSAQVPLFVWLPDAMEGPTPVSALIHAATMVTAGVYMVCRLGPLFSASEAVSAVVAWVGGVTAVLAASIALVQNDIKRVLAYSTISQLGYMFIGCGVGAYAAGMFHLFTHAFFKSLLFLAAGSVIHALGGEQDMRRMGGLRRHLPLTHAVMLVGALAISGLPFLSGFFSKEAILTSAFAKGAYALYGLGLAGAVMTAFYMMRLVHLAFYGEERFERSPGHDPHEPPRSMAVPLAALAILSVVSGYLGLPAVFGKSADIFGRFLGQVWGGLEVPHPSVVTGWLLIFAATTAALLGILLAHVFYRTRPDIPARTASRFRRLHQALLNGYFIDRAYDAVIVRPLVRGSERIYERFDLKVIDATAEGTAEAVHQGGKALSVLQSGHLRDYALAFLLGSILFLGLVLR